ncbi:lasso peptide biosynthesis B2 protein [Streptomyces sp. SAJ15]|uniref:lasso peptide biosynthesis B2 protein n=1 Tax=Streptomyces sp. SAJ15 TaxID=2011095 RepID=UPI001185F3D1|nr:lasso peptide biosynthesis B2 protein [Streptomyces sp. SAJ15]TVL90274.1 hypothetical protein CD790_22450 [Streptomyces sp. SAJ15]
MIRRTAGSDVGGQEGPAARARLLPGVLVRRGGRDPLAQLPLDIRDARHAVVAVSVTCAGQGCLQRSVATALLCRLAGTWPDWCTGIRTNPFLAHAWVEGDGEPVGESDDIRRHRIILSVRCRRHRAPALKWEAGSPS